MDINICKKSGNNHSYNQLQSELFCLTFAPPEYSRDRILMANNMSLYYDPLHPTWCEYPDWFAVVGLSESLVDLPREQGYYIWKEGRRPAMVMEFLFSRDETAKQPSSPQQPTAWEVYEQILGIPFYVVFDYTTNSLQLFKLLGDRYQKQELNNNQFWFPGLDLGLGLWCGEYEGLKRFWLRWYDSRGHWIPLPEELPSDTSASVSVEDSQPSQTPSKLGQHLQQLGIVTHKI